jgi:hypothetical protein
MDSVLNTVLSKSYFWKYYPRKILDGIFFEKPVSFRWYVLMSGQAELGIK